MKLGAAPSRVSEMTWLGEVLEIRQPLSEINPIWIYEKKTVAGPPTATPERHPYCELNINTEGSGDVLVEAESATRLPGTIELLGPGLPHWGHISKYPCRSIVVYFLPSVLVELGPAGDGIRLLQRFTAKQKLSQRIVQPPKNIFHQIKENMEEMLLEFQNHRFGHEVRLHTLLAEMLVLLIRWELDAGRSVVAEEIEADWRPVLRTLKFLREHYAEAIYAAQVARIAGVSESRLKVLFHKALGISWVKFLQAYRTTRAAALLHSPGYNVTEAAFEAGFESLSHFNSIFRAFMGASPKDYMHMKSGNKPAWPRLGPS
jgi:AraC-like DNA-binding protein